MRQIVLSPLLCLVMALLVWVQGAAAPTESAQIVTVRRGDVHQVCTLSGCLAYADEAYICAEDESRIARVCVSAGQRVGEGDALIRFEPDGAQDARVLRAEQAFTVREVYADEDSPVLKGMRLMRITSNRQQIRCAVSAEKASGLRVGMWGWLSVHGEALGFASVTQVCGTPSASSVMTVLLSPEQPLDLPEGAAVEADIFIAGSDDVLTLPLDAVTKRETVWWVHDEICTEIPAEVVLYDEKNAWVRLPEGLSVAVGEFAEGQRIRGNSS